MHLEARAPGAPTARRTAAPPPQPSLEIARVLGGGEVALQGRRIPARRAASLLLELEVDDRVLVARVSDDLCWVLSVLERTGSAACLSVPGADTVRLRTPALHLDVEGELQADARHLTVRSQRASLFAGEAQAVVSQLVTRCAAWLLSCKQATVNTRDWLQRSRSRVVVIDETDQIDAARIVIRGESSVTMQGDQMQLRAAKNVLVNGERILLG